MTTIWFEASAQRGEVGHTLRAQSRADLGRFVHRAVSAVGEAGRALLLKRRPTLGEIMTMA